MSDPAAPRVSVVVVNHNGREHLSECLEALCADQLSPAFDVWVVDNASHDQSGEIVEAYALRRAFIHLLRNPVNRGYAGGVNTALPHLRSEFVAALNPDCLVEPGWLSAPIALMQAQPHIGAVNPLILLHNDERINAAGQDVHVTGLGFNRWLWQPRAKAGSAPMRVSGIQGGALILRRSVLQHMGGWDESGFLYHEDVELSWLLQLMGYELCCAPASIVRHKYHLTMYPEKLFLLERNRWAMLATHLRPLARWVLAPWLIATEILMWGYCLLRGPGFLQAKAASYYWIITHTRELAQQARRIETLRRRSDWHVLRRLRWNYVWDQLLSLGQERGRSKRQPPGGLPVNIHEAR
jgi:hypothetical protein